jgi:hypothetical protein
MKSYFTPALLLLLTGCQPDQPAATPPAARPAGFLTTAYAGEYNWGDPTRKQAGGTLTVYPESDSTVLVYFDSSNGPPAFHLGMLLQRAVVRRGTARLSFQNDAEDTGCQLAIAFTPQAAVVKTLKGQDNCDLGAGVYADATYRRTSTAVPQQFVNDEGTAVKFKGLNPEKYNNGEQ